MPADDDFLQVLLIPDTIHFGQDNGVAIRDHNSMLMLSYKTPLVPNHGPTVL